MLQEYQTAVRWRESEARSLEIMADNVTGKKTKKKQISRRDDLENFRIFTYRDVQKRKIPVDLEENLCSTAEIL